MKIKDYLEDYYHMRISNKGICENLGIKDYEFQKYMRENNYPTRTVVNKIIQLGNEELNNVMKYKYNDIVQRCNSYECYHSDSYDGLEYLSHIEWVHFCMKNSKKIKAMWNEYIECGRDSRKAISIDRIDEKLGYTVNNMQFIISGANSLKVYINPVEVVHNKETYYFLSPTEASRFFNTRKENIMEAYKKTYSTRKSKEFKINNISDKEVFYNKGVEDIEEYYKRFIFK